MDVKLYMKYNQLQTFDAKCILENLKGEFNGKHCEDVLDIGSGPGNVTAEVLRPFLTNDCNIVGSDISEEMVIYANQRYSCENLKFKQLDIQHSYIWNKWKKESFDKIFSFYCLHWIKNLRQAAINMFSLLKEGGEIFLIFLDSNPVYNVCTAMVSNPKWSIYLKDLEKIRSPLQSSKNPSQDFIDLLESVHFKNVKVSVKERRYTFASKDSLIAMMQSITPFLKEIPEELHGEFVEDFQSNLPNCNCSYDIKDDGSMEVRYNLLISRAFK